MTQDTPLTGALAAQAEVEPEPEPALPYAGPFWIWAQGHSLVSFVAGCASGKTHGPVTAGAFLQLLASVRATEVAEQHKRDCQECMFELTVYRVLMGAAEPLCPVGAELVTTAARARRDALQALGVLA